MITTVTCEQCGKQFTAWFTRRFCDECRRLRNIAVVKRNQAAHRTDEAWQARRRECRRRYNKKKETQAC